MEIEDKETYKKWKLLVNMSKGELEKFYNSQEGKDAGLSSQEASEQGISSGRESARWIMKMKDTNVSDWTPSMWRWAKKQISFISRMSGNKGSLYDDKGNKTRKHTSLLIWGHNPKKSRFDLGGLAMELAPNGKPTNLTPEQYRLVRTPAFIAWFGDWENDPENASKVVDENGEPLVCYHGTEREFTIFKLGYGSYSSFTQNKKLAESYGSIVNEFFLEIKNPYIIDGGGEWIWKFIGENDSPESFFAGSVPFSYDGIIFKNVIDFNGVLGSKYVLDVSDVYMVKKNTQIKLADGTNITFDANNPDIRYADGGGVGEIYYHGTGEVKKVKDAIKTQTFVFHKSAGVDNGIYLTQNKELAYKYADLTSGNDKGVVELYFTRKPNLKIYKSVGEHYDEEKSLSPSNPKEATLLLQMKLILDGYDGIKTSDDVIMIFPQKINIVKVYDIMNADGGNVNAMNVEVKLVKGNDLSDKVLDLVLNTDELGAVGQPRLALLENGNVIGGIFLEPPNSYSLNGKYVVETYWEYKFDIIIERSKRKKGYSKLLLDAMIKDFVDNFPDADQIRGEVINKKLQKSLEKYYGFSCDSRNEENITYCYLSKDDAVKFKYADGGQTAPYVSDDFQIGYDGAYEHLIAPNGKPSNLTPEQYRLVRTPAFKKWFGDWEKSPETSSKVVDENKEPMVCYHGTKKEFNDFTIQENISNPYLLGNDNGIGFFFTNDIDSAERYAGIRIVDGEKIIPNKSRIIKCFLNMRSPYNYNFSEYAKFTKQVSDGKLMKEQIESLGYDGIIIEKKYSIIVFNPTQIKLADGSNTTFDGSNPNIRYADGGKVEPMSFPTFVDLDNSFPIDKGYRWADWQDIRTPTEMNKVFKHYNIPLKAKKNLGKGLFGYAFLTDKDTVVKITNNSNEAFASFVIMQKGNLLTTQAKVFKMYKITNGSRSLYIIEKEYIPQVLENIKSPDLAYKSVLQFANQQSGYPYSDKELYEKAREYYKSNYGSEDDEMIGIVYKILKFYIDIEKDERAVNLDFDDIHTGNMGFKDDKLLCFDCAMTGDTELKSGGLVN